MNEYKKARIDILFLKKMYNNFKLDNINNSDFIKHIVNNAPKSMVSDYDFEDAYNIAAFCLYKNMLEKGENYETEDILDNRKYMGSVFEYTKKNVNNHLMQNSRRYRLNQKNYYDKQQCLSLDKCFDDSEKTMNDIIPSNPTPTTTKTFITNWFNDNYESIFSKSPKTLDYIEHPYPRYSKTSICKTGKNKGHKNTLSYSPRIKKIVFNVLNKEYDINLEIPKRNATEEQKKNILEKNNYYYKIAEQKEVIRIIDKIKNAKHIGKEFNKYKDNKYLSEMFYENLSTESRVSINKEYYSIKSILELKSELNKLQQKLMNK